MRLSDRIYVMDYGKLIATARRRRSRAIRSSSRPTWEKTSVLKLENVSTYYGNIQALKSIISRSRKARSSASSARTVPARARRSCPSPASCPRKTARSTFRESRSPATAPDRSSRGIIQVPEGRHIFPRLTVQENLDMGALLRKDKQGIADDLEYVYSPFPILKTVATRPEGRSPAASSRCSQSRARSWAAPAPAARRAEPGARAADRPADLRDHPADQREGQDDDLPRRAEREPRAEGRSPGLRDGDGNDYNDRRRRTPPRERGRATRLPGGVNDGTERDDAKPVSRSDEHDPVTDAQTIMRREKIHRLPVVNNAKKLIGIVSEKDLLYATPPRPPRSTSTR